MLISCLKRLFCQKDKLESLKCFISNDKTSDLLQIHLDSLSDFMKPLFIGMLLAAIKLSDDDVKDELNGARTYWNKYLETSDSQYRDMAYDELKHAGILLKKYEKERQELLEAVGDV